MDGVLFRKVAAVARLKKRDPKKPDKTPRNYDQTPFTLDGWMDLDLTFDGRTMCTPVYIKSDAHEQLLLSEGVCRQLGILQYHAAVEPWRGRRKQNQNQASISVPRPLEKNTSDVPKDLSCTSPQTQRQSAIQTANVPTVRVRLVQSLRLLPHQGASISVQLEQANRLKASGAVILEPSADISPLQVEDSLLRLTGDCAQIAICNPTCFSSSVEAGTELGKASAVDLVEPEECPPEAPVDPSRPRSDPPVVNRITQEETKQRQ